MEELQKNISSDVSGKGRFDMGNRGLVAVLGVLVLAMVGLGVGVGVMSSKNGAVDEGLYSGCYGEYTAHGVDECIKSIYDGEGGNGGDALKAYDVALENAKRGGDAREVSDIVVDRIIFSVDELHDCDSYADVLENDDLDVLEIEDRAVLYSRAILFSEKCKNEAEVEKWTAKFNEVAPKIEGKVFE